MSACPGPTLLCRLTTTGADFIVHVCVCVLLYVYYLYFCWHLSGWLHYFSIGVIRAVYFASVTSWYPEISLGILLCSHYFCWFWLKSSFCCYATSRWGQLTLAHIFHPLLSPDQFLSFP